MPHKRCNRKDSSSTSDCTSDSCSADCCGQNRCSDESFSCSSCSSDSSCPNFSSLCEDTSKSCTSISECSKSKKHSKPHKKSHKKSHKKCKGCKTKCRKCDECKACGCFQCSDVSISSVLSSLSCSSDSSCPDFSSLCEDTSKSCASISECSKSKKPYKKPHNGASGKKFDVTFGDKNGHHLGSYNNGRHSIHINGKNGPTLHLYRGKTYYFDVKQHGATNCMTAEHCFVLTQSPVGNYHGIPPVPLPNSFQPTASGTVSYRVTEQTPNYFFYQCSKHAFEGGLCLVHD